MTQALAGTRPTRRDIEGLRATAVAFVLLYHFDLMGAGGGFAGVDVFFVISGYLITTMFDAGTMPDRASLMAFAKKRIWRIAPKGRAPLPRKNLQRSTQQSRPPPRTCNAPMKPGKMNGGRAISFPNHPGKCSNGGRTG